MNQTVRLLLVAIGIILGLPAAGLSADVAVQDVVAVSGEEVRLTAETKGGYFSKGGRTVEFSINGKAVGTSLSGGDGVAVRLHTVRRPGLYPLAVRSGKASGNGSILVLRKGAWVVFLDIEGTLQARPFSNKPLIQSRSVIRNIMKNYPVVYLHTGTLGMQAVKDWLVRNRFPTAPVLPWQAGEVFADMRKKGLQVRAVVGTQAVIESAAEYRPKAFSFEETEGAVLLKDWQDLEKKLQ
ncbi:MAG: hypothetical protein OHK006_21780 [Thermodesulfovibrionales bacterium]